jgi:outer membrane lipoprotein-sorting protein
MAGLERATAVSSRLLTSAAVLLSLAAALSGCSAKRVELPTGAGTPYPDAARVYGEAVQDCRGVNTLQATLGLSGRAGSTSLRGTVDAGFAAPDRLRLEGRHPLGRPVFILVATGASSTLLMPRDDRVLRGIAPESIVEALVGLPLTPAELRSLVSGCGFAAGDPGEGREYPGGYVAVDVAGATMYLRRAQNVWHVAAARRPPLSVVYSDVTSGRAATMRVVSTGTPPADLTVRLSDVNINVTMGDEVFSVDVPPEAQPLTLEQLRRAGPLGGQ